MSIPKTIVAPPRKGARRPTGAGPHASTPNRRRTRGQAGRAALAEATL